MKIAETATMRRVLNFLTLAGLGTPIASLFRLFKIAFSDQTTLTYLVFLFAIIALFANWVNVGADL